MENTSIESKLADIKSREDDLISKLKRPLKPAEKAAFDTARANIRAEETSAVEPEKPSDKSLTESIEKGAQAATFGDVKKSPETFGSLFGEDKPAKHESQPWDPPASVQDKVEKKKQDSAPKSDGEAVPSQDTGTGDQPDIDDSSESSSDTSIAKIVNTLPRSERQQIWEDYKAQKERIGWAQAIETIGHALTKYFAARQGVTGVDAKATDWGSFRDLAFSEYRQRESEIDERESAAARDAKEATRISERQEDIGIRKDELADRRKQQDLTAKALEDNRKLQAQLRREQMQVTKDVAAGRIEAKEASDKKKELKKQQEKAEKEAKANRKAYLKGLSKKLKELSKIDGDDLDTPSELREAGVPDALISKMEDQGIVSESSFVNSDEDRIKETLLVESTDPSKYVPELAAPAAAPEGKVKVQNPQGVTGYIPASQLEKALAEGYQRVD